MGEKSDQLPGEDDLRALALAMHTGMASNQAQAWCRMLYRIALVSPPELAARIVWVVEAVLSASRVTVDRDELVRIVERNEAYRVGMTGTRLELCPLLTLHALVTAAEQEIGTDHVDFQPIRWCREGTRARARILAQQEAQWKS